MYERHLKKWSTNVLIVIKRDNNNKCDELWTQEHYKDYDLQLMNLNMTQVCLKCMKESECF